MKPRLIDWMLIPAGACLLSVIAVPGPVRAHAAPTFLNLEDPCIPPDLWKCAEGICKENGDAKGCTDKLEVVKDGKKKNWVIYACSDSKGRGSARKKDG